MAATADYTAKAIDAAQRRVISLIIDDPTPVHVEYVICNAKRPMEHTGRFGHIVGWDRPGWAFVIWDDSLPHITEVLRGGRRLPAPSVVPACELLMVTP